LRNLVGVNSLAQDLLPDADNTRSIGFSTARLAYLYAVNVVTGDIMFQEKHVPYVEKSSKKEI